MTTHLESILLQKKECKIDNVLRHGKSTNQNVNMNLQKDTGIKFHFIKSQLTKYPCLVRNCTYEIITVSRIEVNRKSSAVRSFNIKETQHKTGIFSFVFSNGTKYPSHLDLEFI